MTDIRPNFRVTFPNPVNMAKYIYNALKLNYNPPQNVHLDDTDYRCPAEREEIFKKCCTKE